MNLEWGVDFKVDGKWTSLGDFSCRLRDKLVEMSGCERKQAYEMSEGKTINIVWPNTNWSLWCFSDDILYI